MANNVTVFENAQVPAFLQGYAQTAQQQNAQLAALASGYPTISIKGKVFTLVHDGDRRILTRPDDPNSPASYILCTIVAASGTVKTYYDRGYTDNAEDNKPTCFSNDGIHPDAGVEHKQCDNCRMCKYNVFGTARNESGGFGKGKACTDSIRLAVMSDINGEAYLLRVPPASLRALGKYSQMLMKRGIPFNGVVTRIGFELQEAAPKLTFDFHSFLDQASYTKVLEIAQDDLTLKIIGKEPFPTQAPAQAPVQTTAPQIPQAPAYMKVQPAQAPQPAPMAAPVVAPAPVQEAPQPMQAAPVMAPAPMTNDELTAAFNKQMPGEDLPW